jgi:DNA polymerase-3 subunit epsilon
MRQICLDTETTGFDYRQGHRIIEFAGVELIDRKPTGNNLHFYFNPQAEVDEKAYQVHGLSNTFLNDKPLFVDKMDTIIHFIKGAQLIIHNAAFDVPFLNHEIQQTNHQYGTVEDHASITDTLTIARRMHPGQRNSLDALCKRYGVNNKNRTWHGALLDSELLAEVYLLMTGGQIALNFNQSEDQSSATYNNDIEINPNIAAYKPPVIEVSNQALKAHQDYMTHLKQQCDQKPLWLSLEQ